MLGAQAKEKRQEVKEVAEMKKLKCKDCGKICYSSSSRGRCPYCGGELE